MNAMNSAVITKVEYMFPGENEYTVLDIVPHAGKLSHEPKLTSAGLLYSAKADFLIAGTSTELNQQMSILNARKSIFRLTDADGLVYIVGSESYPARILSVLDLGGSPGSFKGYRCTITLTSPTGCMVQNPV